MKENDDICFEIESKHFLNFCTLLNKIGCNVSAVNEFTMQPLVWVQNSTLLQSQMLQMLYGMTCAGFPVIVHANKQKGNIYTRLHNTTYFDLLRHCNTRRQQITAWSPPTSFECPKLVYK